VRRAELQANGTIFNKQTKILGYADDIGIIGRSQAAVWEAFLALEREADKAGLKIKEIRQNILLRMETRERFATKLLKSSNNLCIWDPW
jgi:hypothetical protein